MYYNVSLDTLIEKQLHSVLQRLGRYLCVWSLLMNCVGGTHNSGRSPVFHTWSCIISQHIPHSIHRSFMHEFVVEHTFKSRRVGNSDINLSPNNSQLAGVCLFCHEKVSDTVRNRMEILRQFQNRWKCWITSSSVIYLHSTVCVPIFKSHSWYVRRTCTTKVVLLSKYIPVSQSASWRNLVTPRLCWWCQSSTPFQRWSMMKGSVVVVQSQDILTYMMNCQNISGKMCYTHESNYRSKTLSQILGSMFTKDVIFVISPSCTFSGYCIWSCLCLGHTFTGDGAQVWTVLRRSA